MDIRFTKMHGAGNDYLFVDVTRKPLAGDATAIAQAMSHRHTGVGSDGLILIARTPRADFRMIMHNVDGTQGEMCGNGVRCLAKYVYEHGLTKKKELEIETSGGTVRTELHVTRGTVEAVTVAMGRPRPIPPSFHARGDGVKMLLHVPVQTDDRTFQATVVSMGNPHCVIEVDGLDDFPVEYFGSAIERHPDFPSRTNVEFVEFMAPNHVWQRTWERGSGETLACGSGACATAVALRAAGRIGGEASIELLGGTLRIRIADDGEVFMTGPAVEVFSGEWPNGAPPRPLKKKPAARKAR